jgi:hypothetical protein
MYYARGVPNIGEYTVLGAFEPPRQRGRGGWTRLAGGLSGLPGRSRPIRRPAVARCAGLRAVLLTIPDRLRRRSRARPNGVPRRQAAHRGS